MHESWKEVARSSARPAVIWESERAWRRVSMVWRSIRVDLCL